MEVEIFKNGGLTPWRTPWWFLQRHSEETAGAEENDYSHVVTADQDFVKDQVVV